MSPYLSDYIVSYSNQFVKGFFLKNSIESTDLTLGYFPLKNSDLACCIFYHIKIGWAKKAIFGDFSKKKPRHCRHSGFEKILDRGRGMWYTGCIPWMEALASHPWWELPAGASVCLDRRRKEVGQFIDLSIGLVNPSPYQKRKRFDKVSLERLADDIKLNGLLNPILCRPQNGRYELVHGERRWRACKLIPWTTIPAQIREMTDLEARRICAAENVHREDLSPVELIDATANWIDSCLMDIEGYPDFGKTYLDRVGFLLGKMFADTKNETDYFIYKFIDKIEAAFAATNRNITWQSFHNNDLRPYLNWDEDVKEVAIEHNLAKSKAPELQKLKEAAPEVFEELKETGQVNLGIFTEDKYDIEEVSARELRRKAQHERTEREGILTMANFLEPLPIVSEYRAIVIDPPWPIQKILREVRPNQDVFDYATMTLEEIGKLPIEDLADPAGCHVYLWVTHKFLPEGLRLFEQWGVKYECLMTWVKNVGFTPFSWMYSTEHVLFGRIGSLAVQRKGLRLDFEGKVREHSRKPDEFYALVIQASPEPRIDLFSREAREGFDKWGKEANKFNEA